MTEGTLETDCGCKVGRTSSAYDLETVDEFLQDAWLGRDQPKRSLRKLADEFNRQVLAAAIGATGDTVLDGQLASYYRALTDDDASTGERVEVTRELERAGVDVDAVLSDFVSHQTIHTHLTTCLGVERTEERTDPTTRRADEQDKVQALLNRCTAVTEDSIERLATTDDLIVGEFELFVDLSVLCTDCGQRQSVTDLLRAGHCNCSPGPPEE